MEPIIIKIDQAHCDTLERIWHERNAYINMRNQNMSGSMEEKLLDRWFQKELEFNVCWDIILMQYAGCKLPDMHKFYSHPDPEVVFSKCELIIHQRECQNCNHKQD